MVLLLQVIHPLHLDKYSSSGCRLKRFPHTFVLRLRQAMELLMVTFPASIMANPSHTWYGYFPNRVIFEE
jgi:hypothetical protein